MGEVIPLHKKGDKSNVDNYRGITLLSAFGKLFTRLLNNRLTGWAENYAVLIEAQAGFRKHMCTADNIYVLNGLTTHLFNNYRQLYFSFIDFSKAFDYVERDILWFKLIKYGVRGKMLDIIMSMYENIESRVKLYNKLSQAFSCMTGVRHGECLSPILLLCMLMIWSNNLEQFSVTT